MLRLSKLLIILLLVPAVLAAQRGGGGGAQPADAGPFGALRWRSLGPPRGGRSIAVAGSVARPNEYYMGATGGGLWQTTDGGPPRPPVTHGAVPSPPTGAPAPAPPH